MASQLWQKYELQLFWSQLSNMITQNIMNLLNFKKHLFNSRFSAAYKTNKQKNLTIRQDFTLH